MIAPEFIPFRAPDGLWCLDTNTAVLPGTGLHWRDPSDPFGNALSVLLSPAGDDYTATVFYAGLPMLVVRAGSASAHMESGRWTDYEWSGVQVEDSVEVTAMFHHLIGSIGDDAIEECLAAGPVDFDYWLAEYEGTDVDDGHELVAFVGDVAWAMWDWTSVNADTPLPISPDQLGWNR